MLSLSKCNITLSKSTLYLRLISLIYGFTALMLINSQLNWLVKSIFLIYLLCHLFTIIYNPKPHANLKELNFLQDKWRLVNAENETSYYKAQRVMLNTGLFFLLELSNESERKVVIIFSDQITSEDYRLLRLIEKIN